MLFYTCQECGEQCPSEDIWIWCKLCNARHFKQQFNSWTSGNSIIDKFIQDTQLNASNHFQKLEWIPYENFNEIKYLSQGGYGKVYKAIWKNGYIYKWDVEKKDWSRRCDLLGDTKVVLKSLHNSKEISPEFFNEIKHQKLSIGAKGGYKIIPCYGITKDPMSDSYMMVMRFAEEGSLRSYLDEKFFSLDWYQKLKILYGIVKGLDDIHNVGLTHRDFHGGNIVMFDFEDTCITDFGLCKPINHNSSEKERPIFGVLPYIAPEVLCRREYTQPADIYSLGILMNEMANGLPPYKDEPHDIHLALGVCNGLRPEIDADVTPKLFIQLTKRCWDAKPENRPTTHDLTYQIGKWFGVYESEEYDEFWSQVKEIELKQKMDPPKSNPSKSTLEYKKHPQAIYTSRPLVLPNLPKPVNAPEHGGDDSRLIHLKIPDIF